MIENEICAYCRTPIVRAENQPNSRSVEHMIPNAFITRKRKNDEGDFYVCRQCNSRKSHIDNLLGKTSKMQSPNTEIASSTLKKVSADSSNTKGRFMDMINSSKSTAVGVEMTLPICGSELVEYIEFLGKGQYLKQNGRVFDTSTHVFEIDYITKHVFLTIEEDYQKKFGSSPFRDLEKNQLSEVVNNDQCTIWSRDNQYLFIFHVSTAIIVKVLERNRNNEKRAQKSVNSIMQNFDYDPKVVARSQ